jgi:peptide/nickel transport system substrate-binding protein
MRASIRMTKSVFCLFLALVLLVSCGAPQQEPEQQPVQEQQAEQPVVEEPTAAPAVVPEPEEKAFVSFTIATPVDPQSLDPAYDTNRKSISVMSQIYDRLIWWDGDGKLEPALATSWEMIDDTTLELKLREGVTFHNGDPFTADDVVFTFERLLDADNPVPLSSYMVGSMSGIEKVDDMTVRITTPSPRALIVSEVARISIVSQKAVEAGGEQYGLTPVGTGPFKLVRWDKNERIVFEAFDDHWRGRPELDELVFKIIPDEFARFAAIMAGEADVIPGVPPERVAELERNPNIKVVTVQSARNMFVGMNTWEPPFDDVRVRQAMNYAVDVQLIVDTILSGYGVPNNSICGQVVVGFDPDLEGYDYDPEKAKALLAEAGYPDGLEVMFWGTNARYLKDKEIQEAIGAQLAEVGVKVTHNMPEWADYWGKYRPGELDGLMFLGTGNDLMDCDMTMTYRYYSQTAGQYFNSPELDALIEKEQAEVDPAKRQEIFDEIQRYIRDQAAWIFLYDPVDLYAINAQFDWQPRPDELEWAYDIKVAK